MAKQSNQSRLTSWQSFRKLKLKTWGDGDGRGTTSQWIPSSFPSGCGVEVNRISLGIPLGTPLVLAVVTNNKGRSDSVKKKRSRNLVFFCLFVFLGLTDDVRVAVQREIDAFGDGRLLLLLLLLLLFGRRRRPLQRIAGALAQRLFDDDGRHDVVVAVVVVAAEEEEEEEEVLMKRLDVGGR